MSYDIWLEIDTGGPEPAWLGSWSPTYNYGPMFDHAFGEGGVKRFDGVTASEAEPQLRLAIDHMEDRPDIYRAFDAPNGWGTFDSGIVDVLREWADRCREHPKATVRVT